MYASPATSRKKKEVETSVESLTGSSTKIERIEDRKSIDAVRIDGGIVSGNSTRVLF
jgi:hypothetical protein